MSRVILISLLILTILGLVGRQYVQKTVLPLVTQLRHGVVSVRTTATLLARLPDLPEEIEKQDRLIASLLVDQEQRDQIRKENEALRQLLELPKRRAETVVLGEVYGSLPGSFGNLLLVWMGSDHTLSVGTAVYAQGAAFGRVTSQEGARVMVQPLTSPKSAIAVSLGEKGAVGLLTGENGAAVVNDISAAYEVAAGDIVQVAKGDETFPNGAVVGQVREVQQAAGDFVKRALITLIAEPRVTNIVQFHLP